jgi:NAD(P)-dependent dehydrogenase (short-subunit alcohol dehydrogenase family)
VTEPLLQGRVAVVTGGSSGMGRSIALRIAEHGARAVVLASRGNTPREGGRPTEELVRERGAECVFVETDVAERAQVQRAVEAAEEFGGLDLMVNNAGILQGKDFLEVTEADLAHTMDVNFGGTFFGAQAAAASMIAGGRSGTIVNVSSIGAVRGHAMATMYSASKGAVDAFTRSLADALGPHGIRVNGIHPGHIETEMLRVDLRGGSPLRIPLGRRGLPEEVADAVVYLASGLSSYVHGTTLVLDGGYSAVL